MQRGMRCFQDSFPLDGCLWASILATRHAPRQPKATPINNGLQEVHDLCAERTRLRIYHPDPVGHPRFAEIEQRIAKIHDQTLRTFETVATDAILACSEEPRYGQPSYGVILYATALMTLLAKRASLCSRGQCLSHPRLVPETGDYRCGLVLSAKCQHPQQDGFVVACIQDAPEEIENMEKRIAARLGPSTQPADRPIERRYTALMAIRCNQGRERRKLHNNAVNPSGGSGGF